MISRVRSLNITVRDILQGLALVSVPVFCFLVFPIVYTHRNNNNAVIATLKERVAGLQHRLGEEQRNALVNCNRDKKLILVININANVTKDFIALARNARSASSSQEAFKNPALARSDSQTALKYAALIGRVQTVDKPNCDVEIK